MGIVVFIVEFIKLGVWCVVVDFLVGMFVVGVVCKVFKVVGDVIWLLFGDDVFDVVIISFGLCNVVN